MELLIGLAVMVIPMAILALIVVGWQHLFDWASGDRAEGRTDEARAAKWFWLLVLGLFVLAFVGNCVRGMGISAGLWD